MYLDHFQLSELPFRLSPDPAFLYLSQIHSRAKAYMESTIWFTDGFVVITGEIGSGKTTLIETFLKELEQEVVVAQLNQTQISPLEFLQTLLAQFGFSPFKMRKAELLATLNQFLIEQYANGRKVLLIIDEAQNLSNKVLEEVRLLSGVETTKEKVLRIILAGQPELNDKLDSADLVQLKQRVRLRFHLTALKSRTPPSTSATACAWPAPASARSSSPTRSRCCIATRAAFHASSTRCATRRCSPRSRRTAPRSASTTYARRSPSCSGSSTLPAPTRSCRPRSTTPRRRSSCRSAGWC